MADGGGADYEEALMETVNNIWEKWDKNENGNLDKAEMRQFVEATLLEAGQDGKAQRLSDEEFNSIFNEFDIDGSGTIEKDEMAILVKRMA